MEVIGKIRELINDEHAIISVVGIRDSNASEWKTNESQIKELITPNGEVFEPGFTRNFNFNRDDYIIFKVKLNPKIDTNTKDKAHYQVSSNPKPAEYRLLETDHLLLNDHFIDMEYLNENINDFPTKFYLKNNDKFYGPFKKNKNAIVPKIGKSVNVYNDVFFISDGATKLVPDPPKPSKENIQAETDKQINTWLKSILKNVDSPLTKALKSNTSWKSEFSEIDFQDSSIDKARLELAINNIENIDLTYSELQSIGTYSKKVSEIIIRKVDACKKEIKDSLRTELRQKIIENSIDIKEQEKRKKELKVETKQLTDTRNSILQEIENNQEESEYIKLNKDRLIKDLRLFTKATNSEPHVEPKKNQGLIEFEYIGKIEHKEKIELIKDIVRSLKSYGLISSQENCKNNLFSFVLNSCILSTSIEIPLSIIRAINNCKILYINVQADWINKTGLYNSGVIKFLEEAVEDSEHLYVLILRDINMASPECYFRDLLDFNNGYIPQLSQNIKEWPRNFKIVGTVLPYPQIGMPILKSSFNSWTGCNSEDLKSTERIAFKNENKVSIEWLYDNISEVYTNNIEDFFDEI